MMSSLVFRGRRDVIRYSWNVCDIDDDFEKNAFRDTILGMTKLRKLIHETAFPHSLKNHISSPL